METNNSISFLMSDVDNEFDERLNDLEAKLSEEEESLLNEIIEAEKNIGESKDFMQDLLNAVKKGAEDYLDAITDTGDTFNHMKDRSSNLDDTEIKAKTSTVKEEAEAMQSRTMDEARINPFDKNAAMSTTGMSEKGIKTLERQVEAYRQRTKSVTRVSTKNDSIHTSVESENLESLSGLRSFRLGKPIEPYSLDEIREKYDEKVASDGKFENHEKIADWVRNDVNFKKVHSEMMKTYGFKSKKAAADWLKNNNLTIHETSDGLIIVPEDVHARTTHKGYCSSVVEFLEGKKSKAEFYESEVKEKADYMRHEVTERSVRLAKGIGFAIVKDAMKSTIAIVCRESYQEFSHTCEDKFWLRMKRILENCWLKLKNKWKKIFSNIWQNLQGSILNEFLTMINDYLLGIFKNIFKVVRQMFGSIKNAWKIIKNKAVSWQERIFEASKILSAGVVAILGFSLNELIEKGLASLGIPFASFIAECLSGLFAGIMSAIVLMIFDNIKAQYIKNQAESNIALANVKLTNMGLIQIQLNSLKMDKEMIATFNFFNLTLQEMADSRANILRNLERGLWLTSDLQADWRAQSERTDRFKQLLNDIQNEQF